MVQFPGSCFLEPMYSTQDDLYLTGRVTPFGYPRISGCLLLPVDFRSLPRPSSPNSSKTSTVNPYSLDHITLNPCNKAHSHFIAYSNTFVLAFECYKRICTLLLVQMYSYLNAYMCIYTCIFAWMFTCLILPYFPFPYVKEQYKYKFYKNLYLH
jgi:hypothetical protein